jgi:glucose-6-phosphate isomerase
MDASELWKRYNQHLCHVPSVELVLDISRMCFDDNYFERMRPAIERAYDAMEKLEKGWIVNQDENRMVGHYWLSRSSLGSAKEV